MSGLASLLAALGIVGVGFALLAFIVVLLSGSFDGSDLGWIGGNLVVGLVLLISAAALNFDALRERMNTGEARRAGKYGTSAILSTLLAIVILGMLGFFATRYAHRFDWSESKIHTLSDQTQKVLEGLEQEVSALALVGPFEAPPVEELLERYADVSERFVFEVVDPNERPGLLDEFGISPDELGQAGLLRIQIGGEDTLVSEIDENNVTNALVKLTRTGEKVVYFVQGHGEQAIEGEAGSGRKGFARAAAALRNENYRTEPLLLVREEDVPADADAVILAGGTRPLFENEQAALDRYLARGGAVLAMVDPRVKVGLPERVADWGVDVGDDIVIDRALALFGRAMTPLAGRFDSEHAITRDLRDARNDPVMFHEVRSVRPNGAGSFTELVFTGEASWAERDLAMLDAEGQAALDPDDLPGPVPVMVAGTPAVTVEGGDASSAAPRLVVVGDTDFASNELIESGRNRDLFLNSVNWLLGDVEAISIRPNRSRASRLENMTLTEFRAIRSLSLFVLPEAIAVLGVFTWWSRRNPGA